MLKNDWDIALYFILVSSPSISSSNHSFYPGGFVHFLHTVYDLYTCCSVQFGDNETGSRTFLTLSDTCYHFSTISAASVTVVITFIIRFRSETTVCAANDKFKGCFREISSSLFCSSVPRVVCQNYHVKVNRSGTGTEIWVGFGCVQSCSSLVAENVPNVHFSVLVWVNIVN